MAFLRASDARTRTRRLFDALIGLSFSTDSPLTLFFSMVPFPFNPLSSTVVSLLFSSLPFLPFRPLLHAQYALQQPRPPPSAPSCPSTLPFLRLGHDRPSKPTNTRVFLRLHPKRSRPSSRRDADANGGANAPPCVLRLALPPLHQIAPAIATPASFGTCAARVHGNGGLSLSRPTNAAVRPMASGPRTREIQNTNGSFTGRFSFSCENEASEICASGFASGMWPLQGQ
ncbi:hypothetical protein EDB87DRAFT_703147 [Lactarius vividus]|nr:hypothetical protein EDB87DRAFT_703147 [Lactarius vividus]